MSKKILIVGGVAGGATAAARLRRLDEAAEIIIFERGEYISYANCGLPYHIGDVIKSRSALILETPESMFSKYNIQVRIYSEVILINRETRTVSVKNLKDGQIYDESYDQLILSTGSSPIKLKIPGIEDSRIINVWTIPDVDRIKSYIAEKNIKSVVVVGGGFIGLEMAENLRKIGLSVTIVEMLNQVLAQFDFEMAQLLHEHLEQNGVNLYLGDIVTSFENLQNYLSVKLASGKSIDTELVILAAGVSPNNSLAKMADLDINTFGGIVVNDTLQTSDPNIYAIGDVIEVENIISNQRTMVPLAGPANKQGRIAANNIAGFYEHYQGSQGTSIVKVFDLAAASTGISENKLNKSGFIKHKDYESIIITQNAHAGYYPGSLPLTLKLIFSINGEKLFGAQIIGYDGVDKRIDALSVAMRLGASISDLKTLEFAYAPPYSSAKDPVNMLGFAADNLLSGKVAFAEWDELETNPNAILLDVREDEEKVAYAISKAINIPLSQLRKRINELGQNQEIIVFCAIGVRSYNAARILMANGFTKVKVYPAGTRFYQATHYQEKEANDMDQETYLDSGNQNQYALPNVSIHVDCTGMQCPGPIMKVFETIQNMNDGEIMEVSASDPGFSKDIIAWCRRTGNQLLFNERQGNDYVAVVRKGAYKNSTTLTGLSTTKADDNSKTIIVFSGDLDKVLASFIIANGAAAMGRKVTMFFTFWGLNVLRKAQNQRVNKNFIEKMFGFMMPRGSSKLKLSKMNMGGMGTAMMKMIMKTKNVDSLEELINKALQAGVKIIACTMSMDIMGIKEEELIDGVEFAGVGTYLGDAEESDVNLFI